MTAELKETGIIIGATYPHGNLNGEVSDPIIIPADLTTQYSQVVNRQSIPMEFDPRTDKSTEIKFPQF